MSLAGDKSGLLDRPLLLQDWCLRKTADRMELGVRQIRTAGKGSGSIELTLPSALRQLVGLPCRITLHDGERLDILLRPDLTAATAAFATIWRSLARVFARDLAGAADHFPTGAFAFGLLPRRGLAGAPYLCWQDGLALSLGNPEQAAIARSIAACATHLSGGLGISADLGDAFGAACGFLAGGRMMFAEWHAPCDIVASQMSSCVWQPGAALANSSCVTSDQFWSQFTPGITACADLFAAWSLSGSAYPALRAAWLRGRSIELNRG